ncbi:cadherin-like domain-containing protein [Bradyrhizobium sp. SYSU BS000235]|uniref:cadherin-like domain-containing protein n=1 Tax=Bradyrhizobium sp. SYSU BS000235 TaxID=3411332 RepID=UPI003C75BDB6
MITAKANRTSQQEKKQTRDDYVHQEEPKAVVGPLAFLMALAGFAIYLKSFLPVRVEASSEQPAKKSSESEPDAIESENQELTADSDSDITGSIEGRAKGSDNVVPIPARFTLSPEAIDGFLASDSPPIDFNALRPVPVLPIASAMAPVHPSNDNQSAAKTDGKGPSGGGGGGGGGSDNPRQPTSSDLVRNRAPRTNGPIQLPDKIGCHAYMISVLALLEGAVDPDGDQLALGNLSVSSGTLTRVENGEWLYSPEPGMLGSVTLTYFITDGAAIVQQTASFRVMEALPIIGTDFDENLIGTSCADVIDARGGDDNIDAKQGNDAIRGGDGDDHIVAGAGNDIVHGEAGNDVVFVGIGNDIVFGGSGGDRLYGERGNDVIYGESGDDFISGGEDDDILFAGAGDDAVQGDEGHDTLIGDDGDDVLRGGAGRDKLFADSGDDVAFGDQDDDVISDGHGQDEVHGGEGNDHVVAAADAAADRYSGGGGDDTLDYSSAILNIVVDVGMGAAEGLDIGRDLIDGFEKIIGGHGDDRLIAGATSISMTGGDGDDTFEFDGPDAEHQPDLVRKITDFTIGDRVIVASYEVRYRDEGIGEAINDLFTDIYLSGQTDHRPVRFRFEKLDDNDRTFIDVHMEDSSEVYSIELFGRHHLEVTVGIS